MTEPKDGKGFLADFEALANADEEWVEMGWFSEQGEHSSAVDETGQHYSYPELANFHATGGGGKVIKRDVLEVASHVFNPYTDMHVINALTNYAERPNKTRLGKLLDTVGEEGIQTIKELFGSQFLTPTDANPDPLIDTGELQDATAFKTSRRMKPRKT